MCNQIIWETSHPYSYNIDDKNNFASATCGLYIIVRNFKILLSFGENRIIKCDVRTFLILFPDLYFGHVYTFCITLYNLLDIIFRYTILLLI